MNKMKYTFTGAVYNLNNVTITAETESTKQDRVGIRYHDRVTLESDAGKMEINYHHGATWGMEESNGDFLTETGWGETEQKAQISSVLSSIAQDASAAAYDFPEFCDVYGYSEIRDAWNAWNACKKERDDFRQVFGASVDSEQAQGLVNALYEYDNGDRDYIEGVFPVG